MKHMTLLYVVATIGLLACDPGAESVRPALTREELMNPEACKDCHPRHYEQWSASMHAYAAADPVFIAMNQRGQEQTGGMLGPFCVNCHAPMAVREGAITDYANLDNVPAHLKGVTCYFCHNAVGVGAEHYNASVALAGDDVMRAAIRNPVVPSTHKAEYSAYHDPTTAESSLLCGSCHDILTPRNVRLERTYEEYTESIFSDPANILQHQSCQDCHMARTGDRRPVAEETGYPDKFVGARDYHPHLWAAVDVPLTAWPHADAMRSAVEWCELSAAVTTYFTVERNPGPLGELTVRVEADTGHAFPSGASQDRRVWIELVAYDENLNVLYQVGHIEDGQVEETPEQQHPCMFREYLQDENGLETHDFWNAATIANSQLMKFAPKAGASLSHTTECTFFPPVAQSPVVPAYIDIVIRVRPMGMDVLQDLVSTGHLSPEYLGQMPTFTVASRRAMYMPDSRSYSVSAADNDPKRGDCQEFECMMDPTSSECTAGSL